MVISYHLVCNPELRLFDAPANASWHCLSLVDSLRLHGNASLHRAHLLLEESAECRVVSSVHEVKVICLCLINLLTPHHTAILLCPAELK